MQLLADALAAAGVLSLVSRRLQLLPQRLTLEAHALHVSTRMLLTVRVGGQVRHAEVHAEEVIGIDRRLVVELDGGHQKPLAIAPTHQLGIPLDVAKLLGLVGTHHHRPMRPASVVSDTRSSPR